jgi:phage terminase Nu1 subunit (DNA packaging protein)
MPTPIEKQRVSLSEAMRLTGYTKQNLQKLIDVGRIKRKDRATFELGDLFSGVMAHLRSERRANPKSPAQLRLLEAKALEVEMRNAVAAGDLISYSEHQEIFDIIVGAFKSSMLSIPARFSRDRAVRKQLDKYIFDALAQCSKDIMRLSEEAQGNTPPTTQGEEENEDA